MTFKQISLKQLNIHIYIHIYIYFFFTLKIDDHDYQLQNERTAKRFRSNYLFFQLFYTYFLYKI